MAKSKFNFRLLTNDDSTKTNAKTSDEKYNALSLTDADKYTFFVLESGKCYLGSTNLFGSGSTTQNVQIVSSNLASTDIKANMLYFVTTDSTITDASGAHTAKKGTIWISDSNFLVSEFSLELFANYIANNAIKSAAITDATYAGTDDTIMTSKAVATLISKAVSAQSILSTSLFKNVSQAITVTDTDVTNAKVTGTFDDDTIYEAALDSSVHDGDIGIVFAIEKVDSTGETDNSYIFVNLHSLINLYVADEDAQTTVVTISDDTSVASGHQKKIKVEVNKATNLSASSISTAADEKAKDSSYSDTYADSLSDDKFVTEKQMAMILRDLLKDYVKFSEE